MVDYYHQIQERKRLKMTKTTAYENLSFMKGTSVAVERLFSADKYVMTDRRSRLTPGMFEAIMFLKIFMDGDASVTRQDIATRRVALYLKLKKPVILEPNAVVTGLESPKLRLK
ncbi:hypothetical protein PInf_004572 [Phytophthora infestans]|nr:hypothetical protein PInf_004572 [Phytophthora infestans]